MIRQNNNQTRPLSSTTCLFALSSAFVLAFSALPMEAADGSWMFRRSYFTHEDDCCSETNYPKPVSRSAYRPAYVGSTSNYSFRGGYRFNRVNIRGAGGTYDTTIRRESWGGVYGPPEGQ